jgi:hypothetical protein
MSWFRKEKPVETEKPLDYTNWEKDLGFLTLILSRKKGITKEFLIGIYDKQKKDTDYLTDDELEPVVGNIVNEVIDQLGAKYKIFLIDKYFGSEESLVKFITEDVYVDLVSDTINRNIKKISNNIQKKFIKNLTGLNNPKQN